MALVTLGVFNSLTFDTFIEHNSVAYLLKD